MERSNREENFLEAAQAVEDSGLEVLSYKFKLECSLT